ncbi:MAG TPA: tetratricopeptide repeat protein [Candidatus Dormibacteraeota bacterium]|nr:tetratricopeptide repeat protein [Candidatus Dormibacteraeota bacterium]
MGSCDQFTRREFQRILDVTDKQLSYWERLRLVPPRKSRAERVYDFRDLISLRTAKQLIEKGVSANRLRRSLLALHQKLSEVQSPLTELRIRSNGKDIIVERAGTHLEPISGQFILNFETRELKKQVRVMPQRNADGWFALATEFEAAGDSPAEAADAYKRVLELEPGHAEALTNLGMLAYEQAHFEEAKKLFTTAAKLNPENAVAQFNLGSVLEELGELEKARQHLRLAVRLDKQYADAHYNLALVCDQLGGYVEARQHWQMYVELDPVSSWSNYARQRLHSSQKT